MFLTVPIFQYFSLGVSVFLRDLQYSCINFYPVFGTEYRSVIIKTFSYYSYEKLLQLIKLKKNSF